MEKIFDVIERWAVTASITILLLICFFALFVAEFPEEYCIDQGYDGAKGVARPIGDEYPGERVICYKYKEFNSTTGEYNKIYEEVER